MHFSLVIFSKEYFYICIHNLDSVFISIFIDAIFLFDFYVTLVVLNFLSRSFFVFLLYLCLFVFLKFSSDLFDFCLEFCILCWKYRNFCLKLHNFCLKQCFVLIFQFIKIDCFLLLVLNHRGIRIRYCRVNAGLLNRLRCSDRLIFEKTGLWVWRWITANCLVSHWYSMCDFLFILSNTLLK